jgi:hypothetical protein
VSQFEIPSSFLKEDADALGLPAFPPNTPRIHQASDGSLREFVSAGFRLAALAIKNSSRSSIAVADHRPRSFC